MKRKITAIASVMVLAFSVFTVRAFAAEDKLIDYVTVNKYNSDIDYLSSMQEILADGSVYALQVGQIYEAQRNLKIETLGLDYAKTTYFIDYDTAEEILAAIEEAAKPKYSDEDLYWLSRIINAEAGSTWIPDWVQRHVGSVVLNRVKSPKYANTIKGVAFEKGQYYCVTSGSIYNEPSARAVDNAIYILENGSTLPDGVLGQSEFIQGKVYTEYYDTTLGTTTYFCFM